MPSTLQHGLKGSDTTTVGNFYCHLWHPGQGCVIKLEMSPYCFLPNCRRIEDLLLATASSICLGIQYKEQSFSQKTLSVGCPHADPGDSEHANHQMLCICCLQNPHSSVLLPCKERALLWHHPLGTGKNMMPPLGWETRWQHLVSLSPNWNGRCWCGHPRHISHLPYVPGS